MAEEVPATADRPAEPEPIPFATFLESTPPNTSERVGDLYVRPETGSASQQAWKTAEPDIQLHCPSAECGGIRFFSNTSQPEKLWQQEARHYFVNYRCRNCLKTTKTFALLILRDTPTSSDGLAVKFGEMPEFGPPTPARLISLVGPDREMFLRGRRSENRGLGIGAYGYYRRVVENQKGRLIQEIARIASKLNASPEVLEALEKAEKETQFSTAVEIVKTAIPPALLINGHNPLVLLHNALSKGLHAKTDEECLSLATSIRVVLTELAERMSQALKDEAELKQAVTRLLNP